MRNLFSVTINPETGGEHYDRDISNHVILQPSITCPQAGAGKFAVTIRLLLQKKQTNKQTKKTNPRYLSQTKEKWEE